MNIVVIKPKQLWFVKSLVWVGPIQIIVYYTLFLLPSSPWLKGFCLCRSVQSGWERPVQLKDYIFSPVGGVSLMEVTLKFCSCNLWPKNLSGWQPQNFKTYKFDWVKSGFIFKDVFYYKHLTFWYRVYQIHFLDYVQVATYFTWCINIFF